jgi:hypothetical protein
MAATNDNAVLLPTPFQFAQLVSDYGIATAALHEQPNDRDRLVAAEAARMRLIETYERAWRGERLRSV